MSAALPTTQASDGEPVPAEDMLAALTSAELVYSDGATQTFDPNGSTIYVEHGQSTTGEWAVVEDGRFSSFWPPSYRATYDVRWLVKDGGVVGLSFTDAHGQRYDGLYR
ncbi:hypothetical protein [Nocardioides sp. LHG3406-4]|uniref:hypothetical protein n=1 Tax=Nocardioides sp. LHG3406-4 TaxID=2804575 RepID=UPI003CF524A0